MSVTTRELPPLVFDSDAHSRKLPSPDEMATLDSNTIKAGTPSLELMERAGVGVAGRIQTGSHTGPILVLCGPGNNGGDGFVIARVLRERGCQVNLVLIAVRSYSNDLEHMAQRYLDSGGEIGLYPEECSTPFRVGSIVSDEDLKMMLDVSSLVFDCLLGTGQKSAPRGAVGEVLSRIGSMEHGERELIAVDLPSGVSGDTGEVFEPHFPASRTICIELVKRGLVQSPARESIGAIEVLPIGIDRSGPVEFSFVDRSSVAQYGDRAWDSHKGDHGKVGIIGGSRDMPGAPILSGLGALRAGCGFVTKFHLESSGVENLPPEFLLHQLDDRGEGSFLAEHTEPVLETIGKEVDVLAIGPGLGQSGRVADFFRGLIRELLTKPELSIVIDADGLNLLSEYIRRDELPAMPGVVLTPHPGEMGRLLDLSSREVQRDRYSAARELHRKTGATVVLKGASTVTYTSEGGFVNGTGNPFMATAGSGDVLTGIICGLLAQGHSVKDAALLGVYLHGKAGDRALRMRKSPLMATDLIEYFQFVESD